MSNQTKYSSISLHESVIKRTSVYLGTKSQIETSTYISDSSNIFYKSKCLETPAASQCFREVITNASDQCIISKSPNASIWVTVDEKTGRVTIRNDTTCVSVYDTETADGKKMKSPQMIFGVLLSSSNYNDDDEDQTPTGGQNGMGVKCVNIMSSFFSVETVDTDNKIKYYQEWSDQMRKVEPPVTSRTKRSSKKYTEIAFDLIWDNFDIEVGERSFNNFVAICKGMSMYIAAYIPGNVYWNGEILPIQSMQDIQNHLCPNATGFVKTRIITKDKLPWNIVTAVRSSSTFSVISMINGIALLKGTHINHFKKLIGTAMESNYKKLYKELTDTKIGDIEYTPAKVTRFIMLFHCGQSIKPEFSGQRKDKLNMGRKELKDIAFDQEFYNSLWTRLKPLLAAQITKEFGKKVKNKVKTRKITKAKKYTAASSIGQKNGKSKCSLFLPEGDSAMTVINNIINSKDSSIDMSTHGTYSLQGVIPNVRKEMKRISNNIVFTNKILKSERIQTLIGILGLEVGVEYDKKMIKNLPYEHVIIATDQDEDGKGNIRSQVSNFFQTIWPSLIKHGFLQFIITPVIRAYPKNSKKKVVEFMSEAEFGTWAESDGVNSDLYEIKYFKGLGTHSPAEQTQLAKTFDNLLITVKSDRRCEEYCEIYFGRDTDLRKAILVNPPIGEESDFYRHKKIGLSNHLNTETRSYQRFNVRRHIPHFMDGYTPSTRKIVFGSMIKWKNNKKESKVASLSGYITDTMNYHHGETSLAGTIAKLAQTFVNAKHFPILRALSEFGTRKCGGEDCASGRYINTRLNKKLTDVLFPKNDTHIMDYTFSDGERFEPVYMVPVIPTSILEHYSPIGTGWAANIIARDPKEVIAHLKKCIIAGNVIDTEDDFDFAINDFDYDHDIVDGMSVGKYIRIGPDTIQITEMPMRKANIAITDGKKGKKKERKDPPPFKDVDLTVPLKQYSTLFSNPAVVSYTDRTSSEQRKGAVDIEIEFQPDMIDKIMIDYAGDKYDPMVRYLKLYNTLKSNINFVDDHGSVIEYDRYIEVFNNWFVLRKTLYEKRYDRETTLIQLRIKVLEIQIDFAKRRGSFKIAKISKQKQERILEDNDFIKINKTLLNNPGYTDTKELEAKIIEGKKSSFDYLLKMNSLDCNTEGIAKMVAKLDELNNEFTMMTQDADTDLFKCQTVWLKEVEILEDIIDIALEKGWSAWDPKTNR